MKIVTAAVIIPVVLAGVTMVALALFVKGNAADDLDPAAAVNIRVHNGTDGDIDRLWLGREIEDGSPDNPSFTTRYTDIGVGEDSAYLTVEHRRPNYDGLSFLIDGERFAVDPAALGPQVRELAVGGYYTIMLDQDGDRAVVTDVTTDPAP